MRGEFNAVIMLVVSLVIGLIIIIFMGNYLNTDIIKEETQVKAGNLEGNAGAYFALKTQCSAWGQAIATCPGESCDKCSNCQNEFVNKWYKYYEIPYYLYSSGLVRIDSGGNMVANPYTTHCGDLKTCERTLKCAEALKILLCDPLDDCPAKIQTSSATTASRIAKERIETDSTVAREMRLTYSVHCAEVCKAVKNRAENCAVGFRQCADGASAHSFP